MDAAKLIETVIKKIDASSSFVYFDPPYVNKGPFLYENSYKKKKTMKTLPRKYKSSTGHG